MIVKMEKLEKNIVKLEITVEATRFNESLEKILCKKHKNYEHTWIQKR